MSSLPHRFSLPVVRESSASPPPAPRHVVGDASGEERGRRPRLEPYHRASQRELVRLALLSDGAFVDYHGDRS